MHPVLLFAIFEALRVASWFSVIMFYVCRYREDSLPRGFVLGPREGQRQLLLLPPLRGPLSGGDVHRHAARHPGQVGFHFLSARPSPFLCVSSGNSVRHREALWV